MLKAVLTLLVLPVILIACHPPEFAVYRKSIVNNPQSESKRISLTELMDYGTSKGTYRIVSSSLDEGKDTGTIIHDQGTLHITRDDNAGGVQKFVATGLFTLREGSQRLFMEVRTQIHWAMTSRFSLVEIIILQDNSFLVVPLTIDESKILAEKEINFTRRTFQPVIFTDELRLLEVENDRANARQLLRAMKPLTYKAFRVVAKSTEQQAKIDQLATKHELRKREGTCELILEKAFAPVTLRSSGDIRSEVL